MAQNRNQDDDNLNFEPEEDDDKTPKFPLEEARDIADGVLELLRPHCFRAEIAGSIRRQKAFVKDIEIVAIPRPYDVGLFSSGIATVLNNYQMVKGKLPCKYTQRILPEGIKLDLFFAEEDTWGLTFALRTGSARYSHEVLARTWAKMGWNSVGSRLYKETMEFGDLIKVFREEQELFDFLGVPYTHPSEREL